MRLLEGPALLEERVDRRELCKHVRVLDDVLHAQCRVLAELASIRGVRLERPPRRRRVLAPFTTALRRPRAELFNSVVDVALLYRFPEALDVEGLGFEFWFVGVLAPVPRLELPGAGPVGRGLRFSPFELFALRREAEGVERVGGGLFHSSRRGRRLCLGAGAALVGAGH